MTIATLTRLLLIALCELLRNLVCPLVIGATAHSLFGPGTLTTMIWFACFMWGTVVFTRWWCSANTPPYATPRLARPRVVHSMPGGVSYD